MNEVGVIKTNLGELGNTSMRSTRLPIGSNEDDAADEVDEVNEVDEIDEAKNIDNLNEANEVG